eukprot:gene10696-22331_t
MKRKRTTTDSPSIIETEDLLTPSDRQLYPYDVDDDDHCETPEAKTIQTYPYMIRSSAKVLWYKGCQHWVSPMSTTADHIEKLFEFCILTSNKPFCILVPNYVYMK